MTWLVTGATGFLGSAVARALRARGEHVRVLARPTSDLRRLDGLGCEVATGDVTDRPSVEAALDGCAHVVHCAALYEFGTPDPQRMERINVGGTRIVLDAAAERDVRAVHVSSSIAYGPTGPEAVDESYWNPTPPDTTYGATKRSAHLVARRLASKGRDVSIAAPVAIYGPDDPSILGIFHEVMARFPLPVSAAGSTRITFVHVDDCAEAIVRMAEGAPPGAEYLLGERVVTFCDWFSLAARAAGRRPPLVYVPGRIVQATRPLMRLLAPLAGVSRRLIDEGLPLAMGHHWAYEPSKAQRELAWTPRPLEVGVAETIGWYKDRR
jgi:dihydroflavonol-4-reductase